MGCCVSATWKREVVADHKFDYVDVKDFYEPTFGLRLKYSLVFVKVMRTILVYMAEFMTATLLIALNQWALPLEDARGLEFLGDPKTILDIAKYVYVVSIGLSFAFLAFDWYKAKKIIRSRDIAFAFTSQTAFNYYVIRSFPHYCFFQQIHHSKKAVDKWAFFVFFALKDYKRILLAQLPRRIIDGYTLFVLLSAEFKICKITIFDLFKSADSLVQSGNCLSQFTIRRFAWVPLVFTLLIFLLSAINMILALILYIPLIIKVQGNLKEYCCHKIDKRIGQMIRRRNRKRYEQEQKKMLQPNSVHNPFKQNYAGSVYSEQSVGTSRSPGSTTRGLQEPRLPHLAQNSPRTKVSNVGPPRNNYPSNASRASSFGSSATSSAASTLSDETFHMPTHPFRDRPPKRY